MSRPGLGVQLCGALGWLSLLQHWSPPHLPNSKFLEGRRSVSFAFICPLSSMFGNVLFHNRCSVFTEVSVATHKVLGFLGSFPNTFIKDSRWYGESCSSGLSQKNDTFNPVSITWCPRKASSLALSAGPHPLPPLVAQPIYPVPAAASPIVSFPLEPHPGADYWSGSCPIDLILSSVSRSERRMGFAYCFPLLHDWVCATDDTWHCPFPARRPEVPKPLYIKCRDSASQEKQEPCWESGPGLAADPVRLGIQCVPSDPASCATGFLQRTNSLEEKSRLVSAFKERQSSKNLLSCENSDRDGRFRRTETDFSNLFARGSPRQPTFATPFLSPHTPYPPHTPSPAPYPPHTSLPFPVTASTIQ